MPAPHPLATFARTGSPAAFRTLVDQHLDLVYSAARRQSKSPHDAEDITQAVFILLAQKAPTIPTPAFLPAWLLKVTHFAAKDARKLATRRRHHEQEAAAMRPTTAPAPDPEWDRISPHLDAALAQLSPTDRALILAHCLHEEPLPELAASLHLTEPAARKRLQRALHRLRTLLQPKVSELRTQNSELKTPKVSEFIIHNSEFRLALPALLSAHAIGSAPAGLAPTITTTALSALHGTLATGTALTLAKGVTHMLFLAKAKLALASVLSLILLTTLTTTAVHYALARTPTIAATAPSTQSSPVTIAATAPTSLAADALFAAAEAEVANPVLVKAWRDYMAAVGANKTPAAIPMVYATWDRRFREGLALPGGDHTLRLRVMMELAVIQPVIGKGDAADAIWEEIIVLAERWKKPGERLLALEDLWQRSQLRPLDVQMGLAARLEKAYEEARLLSAGAVPLTGGRNLDGLISDLHSDIGGRYRSAAKALPDGENSKSPQHRERQALLEKAETWYVKSLDTKSDGINARINKLYTLGQVELELGKGPEAAQRFQEILADKSQKIIARMWVAHLELQGRHGGDTKEYREGLVQILHDYPADDYVLPLKQALVFSYIHANQPAQAAAVLEQIATQNKSDGTNAYNSWLLGKCYRDMGEKTRARDVFTDIIKRWPDTSGAELARKLLAEPGQSTVEKPDMP